MYQAHLDLKHPLHWTVDDVFTEAECARLIERIDALGPELAPISLPGGPVIDTKTRNNERVIFDDAELAALLFARVRGHVPAMMSRRVPVGANERLRCYRYRPGQRFARHYDGAFIRDETERSLLTLMVYLNEDFEGGATRFLEPGASIRPKTGMALLFQHPVLHEGSEVTSGTKYVLRSDVMFRVPDAG